MDVSKTFEKLTPMRFGNFYYTLRQPDIPFWLLWPFYYLKKGYANISTSYQQDVYVHACVKVSHVFSQRICYEGNEILYESSFAGQGILDYLGRVLPNLNLFLVWQEGKRISAFCMMKSCDQNFPQLQHSADPQ